MFVQEVNKRCVYGWHVTAGCVLRDGRKVVDGETLKFKFWSGKDWEIPSARFRPHMCKVGMHACRTITEALNFTPMVLGKSDKEEEDAFLHRVALYKVTGEIGPTMYDPGTIAPGKLVGVSRRCIWTVSIFRMYYLLTHGAQNGEWAVEGATEENLLKAAKLARRL